MILVLATENKDKGREIAEIVNGQIWEGRRFSAPTKQNTKNLELRLLSDYPHIVLPPETGTTYLQNASVKATYTASQTGQWALGDDSGLEIDALDGAPGLYSSRFAGEGATYADNRKKVLELLLDIPEESRSARFICTVVIASPDGASEAIVGICEGKIACSKGGRPLRIDDSNGFGYDPIFYPTGYNKTFADCTSDEKHRISHRGHAVRAAIEILKKWPGHCGKFGV